MAPTESTILANYLLAPAQLPAVLSLADFTALFPRAQQGSPHVRTLYRDLQRQRNAVVDAVAANVEAEVARGRALRREVARARHEAESQGLDEEVEIERCLFGTNARGPRQDLISVVRAMENAVQDLESEVQQLEEEEAELLNSTKQLVGGLSDLRYGRLSNSKLREQVLEGLQNVQETCARKT